jgi:hypothetical protein
MRNPHSDDEADENRLSVQMPLAVSVELRS